MADAHFMASDPNVPGGNGSMTGDQADEIIGLLKELVELAKPGAEVSQMMLDRQRAADAAATTSEKAKPSDKASG